MNASNHLYMAPSSSLLLPNLIAEALGQLGPSLAYTRCGARLGVMSKNTKFYRREIPWNAPIPSSPGEHANN